jgi:KRAB domain-containing zinc finger protein
VTHKITHSEDNLPYECDVCKKIFNRSDHLATYERTHTEDKPCECDVCKMKFRGHSIEQLGGSY